MDIVIASDDRTYHDIAANLSAASIAAETALYAATAQFGVNDSRTTAVFSAWVEAYNALVIFRTPDERSSRRLSPGDLSIH